MNRVIIMGRLTADPELRQTQNGIATCRIAVAVDRGYAKQGEEKQTDFITVVAWRQTAEFVSKYFTKGKMIIVEGRLRTRTYDDKRYPDVKHYVTEVYADNVTFGETKSAQNNSQPVVQAQTIVQPTVQPNVQAAFNQPMAQATMDSRGNINMPAADYDFAITDGDVPF